MNSEEYTDQQQEQIREAKNRALRILEFSDKTEMQLRDKLKEGEFPPFAVDEAIAYVAGFHYIDDARYAEIYVRSHCSSKSRFEMKCELENRGVDRMLIEQAIEQEAGDEQETVRHLFIKKYAKKDLSDRKVYEKALRYFAGKGFGFDVTKRGISEAIEEIESEENKEDEENY